VCLPASGSAPLGTAIESKHGSNGGNASPLFRPRQANFPEETEMSKFLVLYLAPVSVIEDWKKAPPETRKPAEEKMQHEWRQWMSDHATMFADMGAGVGKTKRVDAQGTSDTKNDIMLYAIVEAESHEAAAKPFEGHPHLQIPQSSIEIMEIHALRGM
jgi:hypothetical protein